VKLLGEGVRHYIRDRFNWFDGAVVVISAIDITIEYTLRSTNCNNKKNQLLLTYLFYRDRKLIWSHYCFKSSQADPSFLAWKIVERLLITPNSYCGYSKRCSKHIFSYFRTPLLLSFNRDGTFW
jgi:hypothetical protein